jgi:catechol 2,3-dioxygenase-like lactoylglutathione lyase family enzyme
MPVFWIQQGSPGPGLHVAFEAAGPEPINAFYRVALEVGGRDNGPPGSRPEYHRGYYGAFVLDPDGHNIEAVYHRHIEHEDSRSSGIEVKGAHQK